jgi:hypothetical protein
MEDVDTQELNGHDEENMFLCDVCGEDHELLFLDSYLREAFKGRLFHGMGGARSTAGGSDAFSEQSTL